MSEQIIFIETKHLILRAPEESDISYLTHWINKPEMREFLEVRTPNSTVDERKWIESLWAQKIPQSDIVFIVIEKESNKPIGVTGIHRINWISRKGTTGSLIGDVKYRGKGYGKEMKLAVLLYAFNTLDLFKINSEAHETNKASIACLESCGYIKEGVRRSETVISGRRVDSVLFGITQIEWKASRSIEKSWNRSPC